MLVPINSCIDADDLNHNFTIDDLARLGLIPDEMRERFEGAKIEEVVLNEITTNRFLLFPYSGVSAETIVNLEAKVDDAPTESNRGRVRSVAAVAADARGKIRRQLFQIPKVLRSRDFMRERHAPAWVAMLLGKDSARKHDSDYSDLHTSHVLAASLLASKVEGRPLRSLVPNAKVVENVKKRPKIFVDALWNEFPEFVKDENELDGIAKDGNGAPIPLMETFVESVDYEKQYWKTQDQFGDDPTDRIIIGDTRLSGTHITREATFSGHHALFAKGIIIPV